MKLTKELDKENGSCDVYAGGRLIGSFDELAAGESAEFEYTYTVTESDLERGYFENTVQVYTMAPDGSYPEFELLDALNNTTVRADVSVPEKEPESDPESKPAPAPDSGSRTPEDKSANPDTGAASSTAVMAAVAAGMMLLKKRRP